MKKFLVKALSILSCSALLFISCGGGGSSDSPDIASGTLAIPATPTDPVYVASAEIAKEIDPNNEAYILFFYAPNKTDYSDRTAYLWVGTGETCTTAMTTTTKNSYSIGYLKFYDGTTALDGVPADVITTLKAGGSIKAIVKNLGSNWSWQTNDCVLTTATGDKHFLIKAASSSTKSENTTYSVSDAVTPMILGATAESSTTIKVSLNVGLGLDTFASSSGFVLKDSTGTEYSIIDSVNYENKTNRNRNNAKTILLTTANKIPSDKDLYISHSLLKPASGVSVSVQGAVKDSSTYDGTDLGLTLDGNKATFKTWAPVASDVKLLVYSSVNDIGSFTADAVKAKKVGSLDNVELLGTPAQTFQMVKDASTNVWSYTIEDVSSYKYYKYQIVNSGTTTYVSDIWGKSCSADSVASQIVDINSASEAIPTGLSYGTKEVYKNPFNGDGTKAVIYEMHITDWSYAETGDINSNVGKYLTIANGTKVIEHLKDLGVTHVQLLPVFDFAETNANTSYNWGYNPYHYNVPEGRYVTEGYTDGTQAVLELRTLISKLHEAGISVIMDVVYNHTNGTKGGSLYDSTVPYYFYRFDSEGNYSNGSGCGNEFDSEATMAKKYIIESLKHWMLDYHFNGFRFDLMGCLSKETMADIYKELSAIDSSVLVYGEPWTGGTAAVVNGAVQAVSVDSYGVGAFDDDFRDSIKGAEFGGFKQGHVQGTYSDSGITTGLKGLAGTNKRNQTGILGLALHYVECHDNYTLFDKLAISYLNKTSGSGDLFSQIEEKGLATVKKWDTLAASYVLLSQGTAFMNGGQEFLRTKRGNENSYNTDNTTKRSTNGIDLTFKDTYSDVYNTYKGLIALRKANSSAFGSNSSANATTVSTGITKYTTGDFVVYFNASDAEYSIDSNGCSKVVDVTSGTPIESTTLPTAVPAKSFVILKK